MHVYIYTHTHTRRRQHPAPVWWPWLQQLCACHLAIMLMERFLSWATGGHTVNIMSERERQRESNCKGWGGWRIGGEKMNKNKRIAEKGEQCVCLCVYCQWRVLYTAAISSNISVLAPDVYGSPPPQLHSPPSLSPPILPPPPILLSSPVSSGLLQIEQESIH